MALPITPDDNIKGAKRRFSVALSFPGEYRDELVAPIADRLAEIFGKDKVLYDKFHEAEFARPNLDTHLQSLYHDESDLIVGFIGSIYNSKTWTGIEWRAIRDLMNQQTNDHRIMLIKKDDGKTNGVYGTTDGHVDIKDHTTGGAVNINEIVDLIKERCGMLPDDAKTESCTVSLEIPPRENAIPQKPLWVNAYAYIVGVNKYNSFNPLCSCENDAYEFNKCLKELIPGIKRTLIKGAEFTSQKSHELLEKIRNTGDDKNANNILFFYYAGYGFTREGMDYITCYDTSRLNIRGSSLSTTDLIEAAAKSGIKTIIMIFDACRIGFRAENIEISFGHLTAEASRRKNGIVSFFSCSPNEYTQELSNNEQGLYTSALIEALKKCPRRTINELNKYISRHMKEIIQEYGLAEQNPIVAIPTGLRDNTDIITGSEYQIITTKRPRCILISGSTHAGKTLSAGHIAQLYGFPHNEMSPLANDYFNKYQEENKDDKDINKYLTEELWPKEGKDFFARKFYEKTFKGGDVSDVVISGLRVAEEYETFKSYNWDVIPLYIYCEEKIRYKRSLELKKANAIGGNVLSLEAFIKKDMEELAWGLAVLGAKFELIVNDDNGLAGFNNKVAEAVKRMLS